MKAEGFNYAEIARKTNRSRSTIYRFFKNINNEKIERRGRKPIIWERAIRRIIRKTDEKPCSSSYLKHVCIIKASTQTIRNYLKKRAINWTKCSTKTIINNKNRTKRMKFSVENLTSFINWKDVIFSDEKQFSLDGIMKNIYGWSKINKRLILY